MDANEWMTTELMIIHGGSYAHALGRLFRLADVDNAQRLKVAFPELWTKYQEMPERLTRRVAVKAG